MAELKLQLTSEVKTTQRVLLITNLLTRFTESYKGQKMATFSTLDECERCARVLTQLNVRYKQTIRRKKTLTNPYAIVLLDNPDRLLALDETLPIHLRERQSCPHCGLDTIEHNWCKTCGDITWLDEYADLSNKMGWPG